MIIKKGERVVQLPDKVEEHNAGMSLLVYNKDPEKHPDAFAYLVQRTQPGQIIMYQGDGKDEIGPPGQFCINPFVSPSELMLYPVPDKDYIAKFRYCPAMKEI